MRAKQQTHTSEDHKQELRRRQLAKIHLAKKQIGLDDDTYRAMLEEIAGCRSSSRLNEEQRRKVIDHLISRGFTPRKGRPHKGTPHNMNDDPIGRGPLFNKIEAFLAEAGRPWSYADVLAKRICKVDRIAWCKSKQLYQIVQALAVDAKRNERPY